MKRDHITEILVDYLDGVLKPDLHKKAEEHLSSCKSCRSDLEETRQMLKAFREEENILPSGQLKTNFYKMLEEEKQKSSLFVPAVKNNTWVSGILKIAAGIALLIGAFTLGKLQEQQDSRKTIALLEDKSSAIKETAMLSLMENQSASKRIKGVHFIEEIAEPDEAIISALAERMLLDQNTNVRLSAVEALGKFTNSRTVTDAFITALGSEKDPRIQIVIIHTLAALQEKKAVAPMKKLLELEETQPFVKKEIKALLPTII